MGQPQWRPTTTDRNRWGLARPTWEMEFLTARIRAPETGGRMKYMQPVKADPRGPASFSADSPLDPGARPRPMPDQSMEPVVMIEEYSGVDRVRATGRTDLWLGLAIALGIAVIGLGVAGRIGAPSRTGNASIESAAPPSIGLVAAPMAPAIVATPLPSPAAKEPSEGDVALVFEVSSTTQAGSTSVRLQRSTASEGSGRNATLMVDGLAPSDVSSVTIDIRTLSGSLLASAVVPTMGDDRPGTDGQPRVGYRSLAWQLVVPGPIPADGWWVEMTWRDGSNGSLGSVTHRIPTISL
jgi:hypothetical protein